MISIIFIIEFFEIDPVLGSPYIHPEMDIIHGIFTFSSMLVSTFISTDPLEGNS